jgi:REP element-mobilizing transposase RayT
MARPLRLQVPGGLYHVMARGNARQDIFLDDADRRRFLATLRSVVERLNVLCHAYCLMGNHYHLLVETPDGNLSLALRQLNGVYAQGFNRRHDRVGHLFQGRFASRLIEKDTYLREVSRYIVLNPVRAGMIACPSDWEWSSYRAHAGCVSPPPFLTVDWLLVQFGAADRRTAQDAYRKFVVAGMEKPEAELGAEPILGSEAFVAGFRETLRSAAPLREIPRLQRFVARPTLGEIFEGCADRGDRNARIRNAYVGHGYTMVEIANHLGLHPMTISRAVRGVTSNISTLPPPRHDDRV